jgi:hypothetical protein
MAKQEKEAKKKRELREKIEKHVDQLPLWDLFQIYLYVIWYRFQESVNRLAWKWFRFHWQLDEEKWRIKGKGQSPTNKNRLLLQCGGWAFFGGVALASYISLTMFWQMPHDLWLAFHNLLVVASLLLATFVGYQHRMLGVSFKFMLRSISIFFVVIMLLYIGSYIVTTTFLADRMVWIPFFYRDYNYHGPGSVTEYLNHENNYREWLKLQVFSFSISSVLYFAAGGLGYGIQALMDRIQRSSGSAQSDS